MRLRRRRWRGAARRREARRGQARRGKARHGKVRSSGNGDARQGASGGGNTGHGNGDGRARARGRRVGRQRRAAARSHTVDAARARRTRRWRPWCVPIGVALTAEEISEMIQSADRNKSGNIDFQEFEIALKRALNSSRDDSRAARSAAKAPVRSPPPPSARPMRACHRPRALVLSPSKTQSGQHAARTPYRGPSRRAAGARARPPSPPSARRWSAHRAGAAHHHACKARPRARRTGRRPGRLLCA
jgi:hypothetical protein